jgi:dTDP-glucose 4,6-dehydratase
MRKSASSGRSYCNPLLISFTGYLYTYIDTNVKGTLNVMQAARDCGVTQVVHTSTSEVYGTARFVPITEEHPLQGQSPYSASKIGADQIAMSFY